MHYVLEYSICALPFLGVIMAHFFISKQFPSKQNRLFGIILIAALFDICMDLVSALAIAHALTLPEWAVSAACIAFYLPQIAFTLLMMLYLLILTDNFHREYAPFIAPLLLPAVAAELLLLSNPLTHLVFYVDPVAGYQHGPAFRLLYLGAFFYILVSLLILNLYRSRLLRAQYWIFNSIIGIILAAVAIQYRHPQLLLTGPAIAVSIVMMYLVTQKPSDMVEPKTGVFTSAALQLYIRDMMRSSRDFSVVILSVNNLRSVNWSYGMLAGDAALAAACRFLSDAVGKGGWIFRMAGSRFAVVTRDRHAHRTLLEDLRARFQKPWEAGDLRVMLTASMCSLESTAAFSSSDELMGILTTAGQDLSRSNGLDLDRDYMEVVRRFNQVEAALLEGLEQDAFSVCFQPLYDVQAKSYHNAEALLRFSWRGEAISPAEFIPIAERNKLILRIDDMVLRKVCRFLSRERAQGGAKISSIEINLSAAEFLYEDLVERICAVVDSYGVDPAQILFEITETAATESFEKLRAVMKELVARGFRFVLDDFGSGYANIAQVAHLPFAAVKLDRSMLLARRTNRQNDILYRYTLKMLQEMGMVVVAEGVETAEEAAFLCDMGVDYIQGYYYQRPLAEEPFSAFLEAQQTAGSAG